MKVGVVILLCCLAAFSTASNMKKCNQSNFGDWDVIDNYCVKHFEEHMTFDNAEKKCTDNNLQCHLVSAPKEHHLRRLRELSNSAAWIGLQRGSSGNLKWQNNWAHDFPSKIEGLHEYCCVQIEGNGRLKCVDCRAKLSYFCEVKDNRRAG